MIPINFILKFQVDAAKAAGGIKHTKNSLEGLAQKSEEVSSNFRKWMSSMGTMFKQNGADLKLYSSALENTFRTELANEFGDRIGWVSNQFKAMYKDIELKKVQQQFSDLGSALQEMAPHINITKTGMRDLFKSMMEMRTIDPKVMKGLGENLEKMGKTFEKLKPKQQQAMQKLFETFAHSKTKSVKELKELSNALDDIIKKQEGIDKLKQSFSDLFGFLPDGVNTLRQVALAAGAYKVFSDAAEAQQQMVTTVTQLGMATNNLRQDWLAMAKPVWSFSDAVLSLGASTQVSMKEATEAMASLANQRVTTNIADMEELGKTSIRMSQAFGMSTDQATEFIKSLYKIGGLSKTEVAGAADVMANVQHQLGLTASEASGVATQVGSMTRTMKVFGGRVKDIKALTQGVAKLNVAFAKAGLSADEANQMLTKMLDPGNLEENILLFQGLGMSASDAIGMMTGDTSKLANMDERMVQLAKNLKAQYGGNVFALKEMAAQYGMTLEQVQSLSNLTAADLAMKKEEASLQEQADKARASMAGELNKLWNQLNVVMQAFVLPLINTLTPILGKLAKVISVVTELFERLKKSGLAGKIIVDVLGFITGGAVLAGLLGLGAGFMKLLNPLKLISGSLGNIKNGLGGIIKGAKDAVKSLLGLNKIKKPATPAAATPAASPAESASKGSKGLMDSLKGISPKQLLAMGAAIFFIAAGIALIVASVALLATTMKGLNLEQINGLIAIMAIVMGGMIGIMIAFAITISILGAAGLAAAPGLLAIGAAMFLISLGVAVIVVSIALLIHVIANSAEGMSAFSLVVATLVPLFVGMAAGIMLVGMAMIMLGAYSGLALAGLVVLAGMGIAMALMIPVVSKLGEAFANMGNGIKNVAEFGVTAVQNLIALKDVMGSISKGFANEFIKSIDAISESMSKISTGSMLASATMKIMGTIVPSATDNPASASTDRVAVLIAESNTYLSAIMDNTEQIVKILSDKKEEPKKEVYNRQIDTKLALAK